MYMQALERVFKPNFVNNKTNVVNNKNFINNKN